MTILIERVLFDGDICLVGHKLRTNYLDLKFRMDVTAEAEKGE